MPNRIGPPYNYSFWLSTLAKLRKTATNQIWRQGTSSAGDDIPMYPVSCKVPSCGNCVSFIVLSLYGKLWFDRFWTRSDVCSDLFLWALTPQWMSFSIMFERSLESKSCVTWYLGLDNFVAFSVLRNAAEGRVCHRGFQQTVLVIFRKIKQLLYSCSLTCSLQSHSWWATR